MYRVLRRYLERHIGSIQGKQILDLGCGIRYPMSLCLASDGALAVGIDPKLNPSHYRSRKEKLRQVVWQRLVHRRFQRALRFASGRPGLLEERPGLLAADGRHLPLQSDSVDGVISFSVLEHVSDLDLILAELARVLKPGGVCAHQIHLYPSLSGGHVLRYDLRGHPNFRDSPWGHLRGYDSAVSLNRLRESEYRVAFEHHFEILEWDLEEWEGEQWLTLAIERELAEYSREELLRRSIFVVACPRSA